MSIGDMSSALECHFNNYGNILISWMSITTTARAGGGSMGGAAPPAPLPRNFTDPGEFTVDHEPAAVRLTLHPPVQ